MNYFKTFYTKMANITSFGSFLWKKFFSSKISTDGLIPILVGNGGKTLIIGPYRTYNVGKILAENCTKYLK